MLKGCCDHATRQPCALLPNQFRCHVQHWSLQIWLLIYVHILKHTSVHAKLQATTIFPLIHTGRPCTIVEASAILNAVARGWGGGERGDGQEGQKPSTPTALKGKRGCGGGGRVQALRHVPGRSINEMDSDNCTASNLVIKKKTNVFTLGAVVVGGRNCEHMLTCR